MAASYEIVTHDRAGRERVHPYAGEDALVPGSVALRQELRNDRQLR